MDINKIKDKLLSIEQLPTLYYLVKWLLITALIGAIVGSISAYLDHLVVASWWFGNRFVLSLLWR